MTFPRLKKDARSREFVSYNDLEKSRVIKAYLFDGFGHRTIDKEILGLDSNNSRGYQSMGILHYLGLVDAHKGFFNGVSLKDASVILENAEDDCTDIIKFLKIDSEHRNWSEEEIIQTLVLYHTLEPKQIESGNNHEIKDLAIRIHRTQGEIRTKISELSRFDPEVFKGDKAEFPNGEIIDKIVWDRYYNNWGKLFEDYDNLVLKTPELVSKYDLDINSSNVIGGDSIRQVKTRLNQGFFRKMLLSSYGGACCITGIQIPELLVASHIKPWKDSDEKEKVNPSNGLLLNALHDKAFDQGLITVDFNYVIHVSPLIEAYEDNVFCKKLIKELEGARIRIPNRNPPSKAFLEYHNELFYKKISEQTTTQHKP